MIPPLGPAELPRQQFQRLTAPPEKLASFCARATSPAGTGYVVEAERASKSREWRGLLGRRLDTHAIRAFRFGTAASSAAQVVEPSHDALRSQSQPITPRPS